ncbi:hsp90 co-chaperone Cdc37-like 1 [Erpetoichthys calabaricus]|uniref:Hsp90 co-chaperone Cdc37-like 1 n=1 Tax=Erpetoichthys calabaricus TaxID=27687 RepID=A0A8C4RG23_ERPCA|nr:hsp90 co-chaperone Cdc37-like 1 [Erpetoichthys calabaricus]
MNYHNWRCGGATIPEDEGSVSQAFLCPQASADNMELTFKSNVQCSTSSIESKWQLAEAQQTLCNLGLHNCESDEQERATAQVGSSELNQTVEEWRQKENMLRWEGKSSSPTSEMLFKEVFNKSLINVHNGNSTRSEETKTEGFVQKYESQIQYFGMLRRWEDSQRYLSDNPHLVCDETTNYLILWCFHLQAEKKEALMDQVAHQAVVMQFILEMAKSHKVDPRSFFRYFFQKARERDGSYLEAFKSELDSFKWRLKENELKGRPSSLEDRQQLGYGCLDSKQVLNSLPTVAEHYVRSCEGAGLWISPERDLKAKSSDESRWMETS